MDWYFNKTAIYGDSSPFGGGELTDRTKYFPAGQAGGDEKNGIFAPSEGRNHANDYFPPEKNKLPEGQMEETRKEKKKKKKNWYPLFKKKKQESESKKLFQTNIQVENIIATTLQATVTVYSNGIEQDGNDLVQSEVGSGFFIAPNLVLTCQHVLVNQKNKTTIKYNGKEYNAAVWAQDPALDVAVITVNDTTFRNDKFLKLGNSNKSIIGEEIIVLGSPLGFDDIVTKGIISSGEKEYYEGNEIQHFHFISANIVQGNSGGPVVQYSNGAVLGIAAAVLKHPDNVQTEVDSGLNAMIPIDRVKGFLKKNGIKFEVVQ